MDNISNTIEDRVRQHMIALSESTPIAFVIKQYEGRGIHPNTCRQQHITPRMSR
jgi:hypothetical protein